MTPLLRVLCALILLPMAGLSLAHAITPAGSISVGLSRSFVDLEVLYLSQAVAARNGAAQLDVSLPQPGTAETPQTPVVDILDFAGFEPYVRSLLPVRLRDIAEFGPLVPDPAPLAVFGLVLILMGFLRRYISA